MMTDNLRKLGMKLGSDPIAHGALDLDKYVADSTISVPLTLISPADAAKYQFGMLGNDEWGDCVEASMLHQQETWALKKSDVPHPWQTQSALSLYTEITGFNPNAGPSGNNPTDEGTDPSQANQYWQTHGLPGHNIAGFGVLQADSPNIKRAIWEFGCVMFAVALPITAQSQGVNWRYTGSTEGNGAPGSWGGHAICGLSYTPDLLGFVSWGEEGNMDNPFWANYGEQVLVPLSTAALNSADVGPGGFAFAAMKKDLPTLT